MGGGCGGVSSPSAGLRESRISGTARLAGRWSGADRTRVGCRVNCSVVLLMLNSGSPHMPTEHSAGAITRSEGASVQYGQRPAPSGHFPGDGAVRDHGPYFLAVNASHWWCRRSLPAWSRGRASTGLHHRLAAESVVAPVVPRHSEVFTGSPRDGSARLLEPVRPRHEHALGWDGRSTPSDNRGRIVLTLTRRPQLEPHWP